MKTVVDARLQGQARRFALRFACDDCLHFEEPGPAASPRRCSLGYPPSPRRGALGALEEVPLQHPDLRDDRPGFVEFCKSFELA